MPSFAVFVTSPVLAIEDQFIITQEVTGSPDAVAPSVPTNLSATAVSQSQINLSWTASTDNTSVDGYVIYRDGLDIATTTLTTYSDTGLSASTLYTYNVVAFDPSNNYSAQSDPASDTTFDPTVVPPVDDTPGSSGGGVIVLEYLSVSPDLTRALIRFGTNVPVRATVYWGETLDYEMGSLMSDVYLSDHAVSLTGLEPSTRYYFRLELTDGYGRRLFVNNQQFTTLSLPDIFSPANVSNFKATPSFTDITLTWDNPRADFDIVRIVKSDKFYPRDPFEGEIIYEGRAEKYVDEDVVQDKTYYYSAFARDRSGNYSSGAVTDARLLKEGEEPSGPKLFADILQLPKEKLHALLQSFTLLDIDFIQDGVKLPVISNTVDIRGDRDLTISIDYEKVPEILKTIAVTMFDPNDKSKTFSFLLRVNKDKTAYQAHIGALERPGKYEFALAILDHKHQGLGTFAGVIVSRIPNLFSDGQGDKVDYTSILWLIIVLLLLALILYLLLRRRKCKDDCGEDEKGICVKKDTNIPTMPNVPTVKA